MHHPLQYNWYLISGTRLSESIELVHLLDVFPQVGHAFGNVEIQEKLSGNSDVLKFWHELTIEAAQGVSGQESSSLRGQSVVKPLQQVNHGFC